MKIVTGINSIKGKRNVQQDNAGFVQVSDCAFLVVCDGNGGIGGGSLSRTAVKSAIAAFLEFFEKEESCVISKNYINAVGLKILRKAALEVMFEKDCHEWIEAGTTITAVILTPYYIGTFWIGDSPACFYQHGNIEKLITPHTLAEELIKNGHSRESVSQQPAVNSVLTQCAGHIPCEPDANVKEIPDSFIIIAGSDGLFNFLKDEEIAKALQSNSFSFINPLETADELVKQSYANGSDDNITAVVVSCSKGCEERSNNRETVI